MNALSDVIGKWETIWSEYVEVMTRAKHAEEILFFIVLFLYTVCNSNYIQYIMYIRIGLHAQTCYVLANC